MQLRKTARRRVEATKRAATIGVLNHKAGPYAGTVGQVLSSYRIKSMDGNYTRIGGYLVAPSWCSCPDHKFRRRVCKHMLAVRALRERVRP